VFVCASAFTVLWLPLVVAGARRIRLQAAPGAQPALL
jgi:hypothetical protein